MAASSPATASTWRGRGGGVDAAGRGGMLELESDRLHMLEHDNARLRGERDALRRENHLLRQSVFDLSHKLTTLEQHSTPVQRAPAGPFTPPGSAPARVAAASPFFDIDAALPRAGAVADEEDAEEAARSAMHEHGLEASRVEQQLDEAARKDDRLMAPRSKLMGHLGAVYTCEFSRDGKLLASGSFDHTVRLWDTLDHFQQSVVCLSGHKQLVSDVGWSCDSRKLVSGSYDRTLKIWDVETSSLELTCRARAPGDDGGGGAGGSGAGGTGVGGSGGADSRRPAGSGEAAGKPPPAPGSAQAGLVQCVTCHPREPRVFFGGSTAGKLYCFDSRRPAETTARAWSSDSAINSLYVFGDGRRIYTGDHAGRLKLWDVRQEAAQITTQVVEGAVPISCVHASRPAKRPGHHLQREGAAGADTSVMEGRLLAVNSYDNTIRVFDRIAHYTHAQPMRLLHKLRGHVTKNWPIKSDFFRGTHYSMPSWIHDENANAWTARKEGKGGERRRGGTRGGSRRAARLLEEEAEGGGGSPRRANRSMLLATGSADARVRLFDVSGDRGAAQVLQVLEGHTDQVYCAKFHPEQLLMATCSADCTVRVWSKGSGDGDSDEDFGSAERSPGGAAGGAARAGLGGTGMGPPASPPAVVVADSERHIVLGD